MINVFIQKFRLGITLSLILTVSAHAAPTCTYMSEVCADPPPPATSSTKMISGIPVTRPCWRYTDTYDCMGTTQSTCQPLIDKGCGQVDSKCIAYLVDGTCSTLEQTYQCIQTPAASTTGTTCGGATFCLNGQCFNLAHPQNQDMSKTAAMIELARQTGTYQDPASMQFFKGAGNSCVNALFGLSNCCTVGAAPEKSNAAILATTAAINFGTPYVMDALGATTSSAPSLFSQAYSYLGSPSCTAAPGTTPFSMMGVTVDFAAGPGEAMFAFDPTSLAISLAIMVVMEMLSCTQDEQMLSMKRGERLCIGTGSHCSLEVPIIGVCLAVTETYCCYNSRLARIINQQGKAQLGTAVNTSCDGFTQAELSSIDFSKMDLTEFMAEIQSKINIPAIQAGMQARINTMGNANGPTSPTANTPTLNPNAPGGYTGGFNLVAPP